MGSEADRILEVYQRHAWVSTNFTAAYLVTGMTGQIALSAGTLRSRGAGPLAMRVSMWTGSVVLLTADLTL